MMDIFFKKENMFDFFTSVIRRPVKLTLFPQMVYTRIEKEIIGHDSWTRMLIITNFSSLSGG